MCGKLQAPTSKLQRNFKLQAPIAYPQTVGVGVWCFSGCWSLDVGAFDLCCQTHTSQIRKPHQNTRMKILRSLTSRPALAVFSLVLGAHLASAQTWTQTSAP